MKTFYYIYYFIGWIIYYLFTLENRNNYDFGIQKGMQVENSRTDLFGTSYKLNPDKKPIRDFMTWKEFWNTRKHLKINNKCNHRMKFERYNETTPMGMRINTRWVCSDCGWIDFNDPSTSYKDNHEI